MSNPAQPPPSETPAEGEAAAAPPVPPPVAGAQTPGAARPDEQLPLPAPQPWSPYPQVPQQPIPQAQPPGYPLQQPFPQQPYPAQPPPPWHPAQQAHPPQQPPGYSMQQPSQRPPQLGASELQRLYGDAPAGQSAPRAEAPMHAQPAQQQPLAPQAPPAHTAPPAPPAQPWQAQQPGAAPAAWQGQQYPWPAGQVPAPDQFPPAGHATHPQKKRAGIAWAIAGGGVAIVIAIALVVSLANFLRSTSELTDALSRPGSAGSGPGSSLADRATGEDFPGFAEARDVVIGTYEKYSAMGEEELLQFFPGGAAGYDDYYVAAFVRQLGTQQKLLNLYATSPDYDGELEAKIQEASEATAELERKFLAQESCHLAMILTREDGSTHVYSGTYFPRGNADVQAQREAFATEFVPHLDADGTYVAAANELAAGLGMQLSFSLDTLIETCATESTVEDFKHTAAAYCSESPEVIYINDQLPNFEASLANPHLVDSVKHEFAHAQIHRVCDTTRPKSLPEGVSHEAVTNSYAVLFFGADRGRVNSEAEKASRPDYVTNDASDAAARLINEGGCR